MTPEDMEREIMKLRQTAHEHGSFLTVAGSQIEAVQEQLKSAVPLIFQKLDQLKDMMHTHEKETVQLQGQVSTLDAKMDGVRDVTNQKLASAQEAVKAADAATDAKLNAHVEAHKRWFPLVLTLAGLAIAGVAGAIWNLLKKG